MSALARGRLTPCPACDRVVTVTLAGTYRAHRDGAGDPCAWSGVPADLPEAPAAPAPAPVVAPVAEPRNVADSAVPAVDSPAMEPPRKSAPEPEPEPAPEPEPPRKAKRHTARVGMRGQFTLPPAVRAAVGLEEGDVLACDVNPDGTITLTPMRLQPLPPPR